MAAITLNTLRQAAHVRELLKPVLAAFRAMLDAVASNRMRRTAAEAVHARSRQPLNTSSPSIGAR
jgi:hypothetical protein